MRSVIFGIFRGALKWFARSAFGKALKNPSYGQRSLDSRNGSQLAGATKWWFSRASLACSWLSDRSSKLKAMLLFGHTGNCFRRFRAAAAGNWGFAWRK